MSVVVRGTGQRKRNPWPKRLFQLRFDAPIARLETPMNFREALDAIEAGSRVRREAWHDGRRWIARQEKDGFAEYVMALAQDDQVIEWPFALGRGGWFGLDRVGVETGNGGWIGKEWGREEWCGWGMQ